MRGMTKTLARTCAGLAVAAGLVAGGAGVASAAPVAPAKPHPAPICNPWAKEHWNLNNSKQQVKLTYQGKVYTYALNLKQTGSCVGGTLTDTYASPALNLKVSGVINKNTVAFSVNYGKTSVQGVRTFWGNINWKGAVSGKWTETGSEHGWGWFSLAKNAKTACWNGWSHPNNTCYVW
jgi:hypothetical protein